MWYYLKKMQTRIKYKVIFMFLDYPLIWIISTRADLYFLKKHLKLNKWARIKWCGALWTLALLLGAILSCFSCNFPRIHTRSSQYILYLHSVFCPTGDCKFIEERHGFKYVFVFLPASAWFSAFLCPGISFYRSSWNIMIQDKTGALRVKS